MVSKKLLGIAACALGLFLVVAAVAQMAPDKSKRPSPPGTARFTFADGKKITIDYSRPKINDPKSGQPRKIFGGVVPFGEPWRTGANEATSFVSDTDLTIAGTKVPAGKYTLYTVPAENGPWKLVISKKTGQWGIPYPGPEYDLVRLNMNTEKLKAPVQQFTISFDKRGPNAGVMKLEWENTGASVDFSEANK
ncbi:MAG: DUF2911 domain-containing protein [Terriglobales bacterium]